MGIKDKIIEASGTTSGKVAGVVGAAALVGGTMGAGQAVLAAGAGTLIAMASPKDNKKS